MNKEILKISNLSYRYSDAKDNEFVLKDINYSFEAVKSMPLKVKVAVVKQLFYHLLVDLKVIIRDLLNS